MKCRRVSFLSPGVSFWALVFNLEYAVQEREYFFVVLQLLFGPMDYQFSSKITNYSELNSGSSSVLSFTFFAQYLSPTELGFVGGGGSFPHLSSFAHTR